jgi:four helix bundle protein
MSKHNFRNLIVWQKSMDLVKEVYDFSLQLDNSEKYNLTDQIRRCSVSIASNIAEGSGRRTEKDFSRFLDISVGSAYELETQIIAIGMVYKIENKELNDKITEVQRMLIGFQKTLK